MPLYDDVVGIWCVLSATRVMGPVFFSDVISSERYVEQILAPFFENLGIRMNIGNSSKAVPPACSQ
jgi:hypothetical protein